ncbi:MAG: hypothetical protein LRY63_13960 [Nitrincola sp.]|nr:hypothetical protein [Nitrincola sp.]
MSDNQKTFSSSRRQLLKGLGLVSIFPAISACAALVPLMLLPDVSLSSVAVLEEQLQLSTLSAVIQP